jgi:hypothetical protein
VDPNAAVGFVSAKYDLAAASGSFILLSLLLNGPPDSVRQLAAAAAADPPNERNTLKPGLNPSAALNPDDTLGGAASCIPDGFGVQVLVAEVLEAGVLDVLERGLRAGTCALEASTSDLLWGVRGGDAMVRSEVVWHTVCLQL